MTVNIINVGHENFWLDPKSMQIYAFSNPCPWPPGVRTLEVVNPDPSLLSFLVVDPLGIMISILYETKDTVRHIHGLAIFIPNFQLNSGKKRKISNSWTVGIESYA